MLPSYLRVQSEDERNTGIYYQNTKLVNIRVTHYSRGRVNCFVLRVAGPRKRGTSYDNLPDAFSRAVADAVDALAHILPTILRG